jgi:acyl carrier protein
MDHAEIERTVTRIIRDRLPHLDDDTLQLDRTLNDLGLASMAKVEIILEIEAEVGTTVPDELLDEEHFGTPQAIIETVATCSAKPATTAS